MLMRTQGNAIKKVNHEEGATMIRNSQRNGKSTTFCKQHQGWDVNFSTDKQGSTTPHATSTDENQESGLTRKRQHVIRDDE